MKLNELREKINKYNLVETKYQNKEDLTDLLEKIKKYKGNVNADTDYHKFKIGNNKIEVNDEQYDVITSDINKNSRIIACAGSGKTTTIVCKIKYMIDIGIKPSDIMLTTFNVDAANNMKEKIKQLFGFMPNILVGTIDSICCKYYYKYCRDINYVGVREFSTRVLAYMKTNTTIQHQTKYLFFDEFQDCNDIQFNIIMEYYKHGTKIIVIGDDAQNIYQWRGSNIGFIMNLQNNIPDLTTYKLCYNYRSTPEIIEMANKSICNNEDQIPKEMKAVKKSIKCKPFVKHFNKDINQMKEVIKQIEKFIEEGINPDQIAILSRNGYPLKIFEEKLEKYNKKTDNQIKYMALITDENQDNKPKLKENHLTLTTIHKAKGLEWKIVFLINCEDKYFPSDLSKIIIEEERRLFYVAITRAKEKLFIYFTSDTISRFIEEIDKKCYIFDEFEEKYFSHDDKRPVRYENSVVKLVQMLNEKDVEYLRINKILPATEQIVKKIYNEHKVSEYITTYYLHADFGEFIDRYISRSFGKCNSKSEGLTDHAAEQVIGCIELSREEYDLFNNYILNNKIAFDRLLESFIKTIKNKIGNIITPIVPQEKERINKFVNIIFQNNKLYNNVFDIVKVSKLSSKNKNVILSAIKKILVNMIINNMTSVDQINIIPTSYLPRQFKELMMKSYMQYKDEIKPTKNILKDIYNVSLCGNILNERRRLLYKNVFDHFIDDHLLHDIKKKFVDKIKNDDVICKKQLNDVKRDIIGELDLLDNTTCTIIDYKCSISSCKLEWVIQLLTYTALFNNQCDEKNKIKQIQIFNALKGETTTFSVEKWNKENEILDYLCKVRNRTMGRSKKQQVKNIIPLMNEITATINESKIDQKTEDKERKIPFYLLFAVICDNDKIRNISWGIYDTDLTLLKIKSYDSNEIYNSIIDMFMELYYDMKNIHIIVGYNIKKTLSLVEKILRENKITKIIDLIRTKQIHCVMDIMCEIKNVSKLSLGDIYNILFRKTVDVNNNSKNMLLYVELIYKKIMELNKE